MNVAETAPALARVEKKWVVWLGRALSALPAAMFSARPPLYPASRIR